MNEVLCAVCSSNKLEKVNRRFEAKYNQTPVVIQNTEMWQCHACGERFLTPDQSRTLSREVKNHMRQRFGLLQPEEIVQIRHRLGITQAELEELFGLGEKVVTRWETGRVVQAKTADIALRLLALEPKLLVALRDNARSEHAVSR